MVTEVKLVAPSKALLPILVTESGIIIEVKPLLAKALSPILVTELGMAIDPNAVELAKA